MNDHIEGFLIFINIRLFNVKALCFDHMIKIVISL